jgi:hypothetical protein
MIAGLWVDIAAPVKMALCKVCLWFFLLVFFFFALFFLANPSSLVVGLAKVKKIRRRYCTYSTCRM